MSVLLREAIGGSIRRARTERNRTLRDVSHSARVSLGYLSEIERGRKEPSSELLAAICEALSLPLPDLLDEVADAMRPRRAPRPVTVLDPALRTAVEEALEGAGDDAGVDGPSIGSDADTTVPVGGSGDAETTTDDTTAEGDEGAGPSARLTQAVPAGDPLDGPDHSDDLDGSQTGDVEGGTEDDVDDDVEDDVEGGVGDGVPGDEPLTAPVMLLGRTALVRPLDGSLTSGLATVRVAA